MSKETTKVNLNTIKRECGMIADAFLEFNEEKYLDISQKLSRKDYIIEKRALYALKRAIEEIDVEELLKGCLI